MTRPALRRLVPVALVAALTAVAVTAFAAGHARVGGAVGGLLLGTVAIGVLDVRTRLGDVAHMLRLAAVRNKSLERRVEDVRRLLAGEDGPVGLGERIDQAERRFLGAFESERLRAADRHREIVEVVPDAVAEAVARSGGSPDERAARDAVAAVHRGTDRVLTSVAASMRSQTEQIEALLQLIPRITPRAALPATGNWALDAVSMLDLVDLIERERPSVVLELGSGTSTVWLGYLLEQYGARLVSLDHDEHYASATRVSLAKHGLGATAEVRTAPLVPVQIDGEEFSWYDLSCLEGVENIDVLLVDGPPKATGPLARFPAVPLVESRMSGAACVVLDDSDRPEEAETLDRWMARIEGATMTKSAGSRLAVVRLPAR